MVVDAREGTLAGNAASDLRHCIDKANCRDAAIETASRGDGDGSVTEREVHDFTVNALTGLNAILGLGGGNGLGDLGAAVRQLATIDGQSPKMIHVNTFELTGAEGPISSTAPIHVSFQVRVDFPDTPDRGTHGVRIVRTAANLDVADRIVLTPQKGWRIKEDSIQPQAMQVRYDGAGIQGTQKEMQGDEALTFQIEKTGGLGVWGWIGLVSLLLLAAAAAGYVVHRRRKV